MIRVSVLSLFCLLIKLHLVCKEPRGCPQPSAQGANLAPNTLRYGHTSQEFTLISSFVLLVCERKGINLAVINIYNALHIRRSTDDVNLTWEWVSRCFCSVVAVYILWYSDISFAKPNIGLEHNALWLSSLHPFWTRLGEQLRVIKYVPVQKKR